MAYENVNAFHLPSYVPYTEYAQTLHGSYTLVGMSSSGLFHKQDELLSFPLMDFSSNHRKFGFSYPQSLISLTHKQNIW